MNEHAVGLFLYVRCFTPLGMSWHWQPSYLVKPTRIVGGCDGAAYVQFEIVGFARQGAGVEQRDYP